MISDACRHTRSVASAWVVRSLAVAAFLPLATCAPPPPADFRSPDPASRLRAIEAAARDRDRSAIPHLIESLDSADPAVRLMAFETLRSLTGEHCGYRVSDPPERRAVAIACWEELARREGWLTDRPRASDPTPQEPPA